MTITTAKDLSAGCTLKIGGAPLDPVMAANIIEVRVETTTGLPDVCTVRLAESDSAGSPTLKVVDDKKFKLGAIVSVLLAKPVGGTLAPVFDGEITTIEAEFGASRGGEPVVELHVTAHDRSHRMHRITTTRTFTQMTVVDIARKMATEAGLKLGTLAPLKGGPSEVRHQVGETDWEFLSHLVHEFGGELDVAKGALSIIDPSKPPPGMPVELVYGDTLQRFRPRVSSLGQVAQVTVQGWDSKSVRAATGMGRPKPPAVEKPGLTSSVAGTKVLVASPSVATTGEAKARAAAAAMQLGQERVQGLAVAAGDPKLLAGAMAKVSGVGTRFSGSYRIVSAVHSYGPRGYTTQLTLGSGGRPLVEMTNGGRRAPRFAEQLVIGLVTSNVDPETTGRVKVKYPVLGSGVGQVESGWARIAWTAAGQARGTVAIPHVNDEVVIAFEHGDVRRPIVLGVLFDGKAKPGADLTKITSSVAARYPRDLDVATKMKTILASDMGMDVKTPMGPITVAAGTEMKLSASAMGAPQPITITTTGQVKVHGDLGAEVTALGPIKISGQAPVTIESQALLQVKAAVIQVEATGILQLKGAMVMLG